MPSTTAFFTGLTGLTANARSLDVIGNNISNVNTTAYKSSRLMFATQFCRTLSGGSPPGATSGGTNPSQIGLGVTISGTQRSMATGAVSPTGDPRDLAIDGSGFFIVDRGGAQLYTRAGTFRQNSNNDLVSAGGERVRGYGVDSNFNIIPGVLQNINIPVGIFTIAEATQNVRLGGNLNAAGNVASHGSLTNFAGLQTIATAAPPPAPGDMLETNTRLVDIADPANTANPLIMAGETIKLTGAQKGTADVPDATFTVTATSTVQDYLTFLNNSLNINTAVGPNPDGKTPGAGLDPVTGVISIVGNVGTVNDLKVATANVQLIDSAGASTTPFAATSAATADGESVQTSYVAYDSLGTAVTVNLRMVLQSKQGGAGTTWRFFAESPDNQGTNKIIGTGTFDFDSSGRITSSPSVPISIDRNGTGAASPLVFNMILASNPALVTALANQGSNLAALAQDGAPIGTLQGFNVGQDGTITGAFSNGLTRKLGQVALATFTNPEGLLDAGGNLYTAGANSGEPVISAPQQLGAGKVVGGALELSNVDLSQEFINLILASTGYSAASRVITTTDQLMQQLLAIGR